MTLRLALAQTDSDVGALEANAQRISAAVAEAAAAGADVVLTPEMGLTGYPLEDLALRGSFQRGAQRTLEQLARDLEEDGLGDVTVVVGTLVGPVESSAATDPLAHGALPTNRAAVLRGGEVVATYDKHRLPTYGVFDEGRLFTPGTSPCVLQVGGARLGLAICEDIWVNDVDPLLSLREQELDALLVLNGSPFEVGKMDVREDLVRTRSRELGCPVAYVNLVGGQDDLVFDGSSLLIDDATDTLLRAAAFEEDLLLVDLPGRGQAPTAVQPSDAAADERHTRSQMSVAETIYRACTLGLRDYARQNGFTKVVLGLSGGIDSALVAAIAADALGGENVVGISMPSVYSSEHSKDDAADTARRLGVDYRVVPIAPVVDAFQGVMPLEGVPAENLQARVRGMILMAVSNAEGPLTLATGNKSELAVGYSTIYGDAVGGFAPIKDVLKTQVWEISRWRNEQARLRGEVEPIPVNSIDKPPSAELRPGQKDSDSLPDYPVLDAVITGYVEHSQGRDELLAAGHDPETVETVVRLVDRAEWKRRQYPLGPKVTALAFGRDRRLPITSSWREPQAPASAADEEGSD